MQHDDGWRQRFAEHEKFCNNRWWTLFIMILSLCGWLIGRQLGWL